MVQCRYPRLCPLVINISCAVVTGKEGKGLVSVLEKQSPGPPKLVDVLLIVSRLHANLVSGSDMRET